ncbi:hypothetical protein H0V99_03725 [Candidatus Saccharibacteria bacterium]|nr:hypothetical protein [Candidatus Saccharibacteria bacterium]
MITQLQAEYLTRLTRLPTSRNIKALKLRAQRLTKANVRRTKRLSLSWYRRQYFLATANGDLKQSIRRNEDIFIAVTVIAAILGYVYVMIATEMTYAFFMTAYFISEASGANMFLISLIAASSLTAAFAWVLAFILNSMSVAIMQGANSKRIRSVRATLYDGLHNIGRTTVSWLMLLSMIAVPVLAIAVIGLIHFLAFKTTQEETLKLLPYYIIAAVAISFYVLVNYGLMPLVALFERNLSYKQVIKRTRQLLSSKGKLFLTAVYGILSVVLTAEFLLSRAIQHSVGIHKVLSFGIMAVITIVYANGVLTMFYRKRRQARI